MDEDFLNPSLEGGEDVRVEETPIVEQPEVQPDQIEQPVAAEPEKPVVPEGYVPLATVLDTRDKLKDRDAEIQRLQQQLQQHVQPQEIPDPSLDPAAYNAHQLEQANATALNAKLDISEEMARDKHGDELVDKVREWGLEQFKAIPGFHQRVITQRNPWGFAVAEYQRQQAMEKLGGNPSEVDQYLAWKAAQAAAPGSQPAAQAQPAPTAPAMPTRSLAAMPTAGDAASREVVETPEEAFGGLFQG